MAFERKDYTASLFKNKDRTKETDRDYRGEAKIGGQDFWLSGYVNETKSGEKYINITFKPKDAQARAHGSAKTPVDLADEVPF